MIETEINSDALSRPWKNRIGIERLDRRAAGTWPWSVGSASGQRW